MKLTRQFHFNPALFSIVPLLNVLFLVLIFYALATRFVLQPGLPIALPASSFTVTPQEDAQIVSVTSAPAPGVYFRNEPVTIDEFTQAVDEALEAREMTTIVAKVGATGPRVFLTDLPLLENRFQFSRHLRSMGTDTERASSTT